MKKISNLKEKLICAKTSAVVAVGMLMTTPAFAADYNKVVNPIVKLLNNLLGPLLGLVGAIGTLYCVLLGVKFAKAEEPQDREKARTHLKNAIIGFVLIFILIVALNIGMGVMTNWVKDTTNTNIGTIPTGN